MICNSSLPMHMQMYYFFTWPVDLELLSLCFLWNVLHSGLSCIWEAEHSDHLTAVNEQMHGSRVSPPSDWQLPAKTSCRVNLRYQQSSSACLVSLTFMFASLLWLKTLILKLIKTILGGKILIWNVDDCKMSSFKLKIYFLTL